MKLNSIKWLSLIILFLSFTDNLLAKEKIILEAENGFLEAPMRIDYDSNASGDLFIQTSSSSEGKADFFFHTSALFGTYVMWARVLSKDNESDAFVISMDTESPVIFDTAKGVWSSSWKWIKLERQFNFVKGLHSLHVSGSEKETGLDQLIITDDLALSSQTIQANVVYHACPPLPKQVSEKCIENLVQYKIKPVHEDPNLTEFEKCNRINEIIEQDIDPLLAFDRAAMTKKFRVECPTCTLFEQSGTCPWAVFPSTP